MLMVEQTPTKPPVLRSIRSSLSAADIEALERRANEITASLDERFAEVFPEVSPHWHVVLANPGQERTAAAKLSDRRFGVYLPESETTEIRRGRKVERRHLLLPGYVLIYVWNIDYHRDRVMACDGVRGILYVDGRAAIVPDRLVDIIRVEENKRRPLRTLMEKTVRKKRHRESHKVIRECDVRDNDILSVHSYSPFIEAMRAEAEGERLSAFHKALGLTH